MADSIWDYIPPTWRLIAGVECRIEEGWIVAARWQSNQETLRWKAQTGADVIG